MAKQDTINKYLDEFLATCSPERKEKFLSKSVDNQYASIINWRRRNREKAEMAVNKAEAVSASVILATLRGLSKKLMEVKEISAAESRKLNDEIENFKNNVANHEENRKARMLAGLEKQARMLNARIEKLRNEQ